MATYWPKQSAKRKIIFFDVGDDADEDLEANGLRKKLPVIAPLMLKVTTAVGRVWRVLDCCLLWGSQRPRQSAQTLLLFLVVVLDEIREMTSADDGSQLKRQ